MTSPLTAKQKGTAEDWYQWRVVDESEMVRNRLYNLNGERVPSPSMIAAEAEKIRNERPSPVIWNDSDQEQERVMPDMDHVLTRAMLDAAISDVDWLKHSARQNLEVDVDTADQFFQCLNSLHWLSESEPVDDDTGLTLEEMCTYENLNSYPFRKRAREVAASVDAPVAAWIIREYASAVRYREDCNHDCERTTHPTPIDKMDPEHSGHCVLAG